MGDSETFNGWSNRETWALMLHVNNDEGLQEMFRERVTGGAADPQRAEQLARELLDPDEYRAEFGGEQSAELRQMAAEVGSLWRVNWAEVVEALLED